MNHPFRSLLVLALALSVAACSSLGGTPPLVELYDEVAPDGALEIELDRSGTVVEMEAEIPIDQLPVQVADAALAQVEDGEIVAAEREIGPHGRVWEVKVRAADLEQEFVIDRYGVVLETEKPLTREATPGIVLGNAASMVQTHAGEIGSFESVDEVRAGDVLTYHVKHRVGGVVYKIVLAADGRVIRSVREQRAEIEIPLR